MIKVEHLSKKYAATTAVDDISFTIGKNEIVGFLGPNGAGKSTILKVLTCFHSASGGKVEIDGKDIFQHPQSIKALIGYLPENVPLYPELRVKEYLTYRAGLKKVSGKKRLEAVQKSISRCHLEEVENRIIGQLSKGFRQRVGLADALLADPKILVLDEPTVGLDPNQIRDVRKLINELGKERTVILSSHILPEVEAVCSRVIIINQGKIVSQGKPSELRAKLSQNAQTIELEVIDPKRIAQEQIETIANVKAVHLQKDCFFQITPKPGCDIREELFDLAVANDFKILSMTPHNHSLEDIFVEIITKEMDEKSSNDKSETDSTPEQNSQSQEERQQ